MLEGGDRGWLGGGEAKCDVGVGGGGRHLCFDSFPCSWFVIHSSTFLVFLWRSGKAGGVGHTAIILLSELVYGLVYPIGYLFELVGYLLSFFAHIFEANIRRLNFYLF